jgi:hypothetical protein
MIGVCVSIDFRTIFGYIPAKQQRTNIIELPMSRGGVIRGGGVIVVGR